MLAFQRMTKESITGFTGLRRNVENVESEETLDGLGQSAMTKYYKTIVSMLTGKTPALRDIPRDRLDWSGVGAVLEFYSQTSGIDREEFIRAMGQIVEDGKSDPSVIAEVVYLAASLDVAQIEPSVFKLRETPMASADPVRRAIATYSGTRDGLRRGFSKSVVGPNPTD